MMQERSSITLRAGFSALAVSIGTWAFGQGGYVGAEVTAADIEAHTGANINTSNPVGATAGVADVSAIGAATYSIPLYVAPGTNGVQPTLSINYNSMGGDGALGYGWSLGGLSAITRVGLDQYHDNACWPVSLNNTSDRYVLDGQRLMVTSGEDYYAPGAKYDTESAQFNYCVAHGQQGLGPAYFTRVVKETGWTYEYGGGVPAQHAQVILENGNTVYMWLVSKVQDAFGNYMTFTYDNDGMMPRIARIDYTGNANTALATYNAVVFDYLPRTDWNESFVKGAWGLRTSKLLKKATIYCENVAFKEYQFNYCLRDHGKSYLREVVEVMGDGQTRLNSTLVKYGDSASQMWHHVDTGVDLPNDADFFSGDFDGDGRSELLVSPYVNSGDGVEVHRVNTELRLYDISTSGQISAQPVWQIPLTNSVVLGGASSVQVSTSNLSHDMNGDGRDDIVVAEVAYVESEALNLHYMALGSVKVYLSQCVNGDFQFQLETLNLPGSGTTYPTKTESPQPSLIRPNFMHVGDFNGDGFGDFLHPKRSQPNDWTMWLCSPFRKDLNGDNDPLQVQVLGGTSANIGTLVMALNAIVSDFDGDGGSEVLRTWPTGSGIQKITSDYQSIAIYNGGFPTRLETPYPNIGHTVYPLDYNGDGKTDLLEHYDNNASWHVQVFNGQSFNEVNLVPSFNQFYGDPLAPLDSRFVTTGDFNGDGLSDIVVAHHHGGHFFRIFYSRGVGQLPIDEDFGATYPFDIGTSQTTGYWQTPLHFFLGPLLDTDGDGRAEMLNMSPGNAHLLSFHPREHQRRVETVADGMGSISSFEWTYAKDDECYTPGDEFTWPMGDVNPSLPLVKKLRKSDGIGGLREWQYAFGKAKVTVAAWGFLASRRISWPTSRPTA